MATITVPASPPDKSTDSGINGQALQNAINNAQPGDTVLVQHLCSDGVSKARYYAPSVNGFTFPNTSSGALSNPITIMSTSKNLPAPGMRVSPSMASEMPVLFAQQGSVAGAITFGAIGPPGSAVGNAGYRLIGLEVAPYDTSTRSSAGLIQIGNNAPGVQTTLASQPQGISILGCYVHSILQPPLPNGVCPIQVGIGIHGKNITVQGNYVSGIVSPSIDQSKNYSTGGKDCQAVNAINGTGPCLIDNNYLEGSTENFIAGGSPTAIQVPSLFTVGTNSVSAGSNVTITPQAMQGDLPTGQAWQIQPGCFLVIDPAAPEVVQVLTTTPTSFTCNCSNNHSSGFNIYGTGSGTDQVLGLTKIDLVPANFTITNNTLAKPLEWNPNDPTGAWRNGHNYAGNLWLVKNIFELKAASHFKIQNNILQYNWANSQAGSAVLFTPRGATVGNVQGGPWTSVDNIDFSLNTIKHSFGVLQIQGSDDFGGNPFSFPINSGLPNGGKTFPGYTRQSYNVSFKNNVLDDIGDGSRYGSIGYNGLPISNGPGTARYFAAFAADAGPFSAVGVGGGADNVDISHNTLIPGQSTTNNVVLIMGQPSNPALSRGRYTNFKFNNNICPIGVTTTGSALKNTDNTAANVGTNSNVGSLPNIQSPAEGCPGGQFAGNIFYGDGATPQAGSLTGSTGTDPNFYAPNPQAVFTNFGNGNADANPGTNYAVVAGYRGKATDGTDPGGLGAAGGQPSASATQTTITQRGSSSVFDITVVPQLAQSNVPTGSVNFAEDGAAAGSQNLTGNPAVCSFTWSNPSVGSHVLGATYAPPTASSFTGSSASFSFQTGSAGTLPVTLNPNPVPAVTYPANAVFTIAVTDGQSTPTGTPTGTVAFLLDGVSTGFIGSPTLSGNPPTATFTVTQPSAGTHSYSAAYSGDGIYAGKAVTGTFAVAQCPTTTVIDSSTPSQVAIGASQVYGLVLVSAVGNPALTVTGTANLVFTPPGAAGGTAAGTLNTKSGDNLKTDPAGGHYYVFNFAASLAGTYSIEAFYPAQAGNFAPSNSASQSLQIGNVSGPVGTTTTLTQTDSQHVQVSVVAADHTSLSGGTVNLLVVNQANGATAMDPVQTLGAQNTTTFASSTIFSLMSLAPGTYTITGNFSASTTSQTNETLNSQIYLTGSSANLTVTIGGSQVTATSNITLSSSSMVQGQSAKVTATVVITTSDGKLPPSGTKVNMNFSPPGPGGTGTVTVTHTLDGTTNTTVFDLSTLQANGQNPQTYSMQADVPPFGPYASDTFSNTVSITVNPVGFMPTNPTTTCDIAPHGLTMLVGGPQTFTVSVTTQDNSIPPAGSKFQAIFNGGPTATRTNTAAGSSGQPPFSLVSLGQGIYTVQGNFPTNQPTPAGGGQVYGASSSAVYTLSVQMPTTTAITSIPSGMVAGDTSQTVTVQVTANDGSTPTGNVTLTWGTGTSNPVALSGGLATIPLPGLAAGTYSLTANFAAQNTNENYAASSGTASLTVAKGGLTDTTTYAVPTFATYPNAATVLVQVTAKQGTIAPLGAVTIDVDPSSPPPQGWSPQAMGPTALTPNPNVVGQSQATFSINNLQATTQSTGTHHTTASYPMQGQFGPSATTCEITIYGAPTTSTINAPTVTYPATGFAIVVVTAQNPLAGTPQGNVSLTLGTGTPRTMPMTGNTGTASFPYPLIAAGTYSLSSTYGAQGNFAASNGIGSLTVLAAPTNTTMTVGGQSGSATINQGDATQFATVSITPQNSLVTDVPSGVARLNLGPGLAPLGVLVQSGVATFPLSSIPAGSYSVTAQYLGAGNLAGSTSAAFALTINSPTITPTTTTITPTNISYGQNEPVIVTVLPQTGTATVTGTVTCKIDSSNQVQNRTLNNGAASFSFPTPPGGTRTLTANYLASVSQSLGTTAFGASTATATFSVSQLTPTVSVTGSPANSTDAAAVATVQVASPSRTPQVPSGQVTITPDWASATSAALVGGTVTFSLSVPSPGIHTLSASYGGDGNFLTATGSGTLQVIQVGVNTTTTVAAIPVVTWPAAAGITANVVSATTPTGTVVLTITGAGNFVETPPAVTLSPTSTSGTAQAVFSVPGLAAGTYSVTAAYNPQQGTSFNPSSTASASTLTVNGEATTTSILVAPNPSTSSTVVNVIVSATSGIPSGTVTLTVDTGTAQPQTLNVGQTNSSATYTFAGSSALSAGAHTLTAAYLGSGNFLASSPGQSTTISVGAPTLPATNTVMNPQPITFNQTATVGVTVSPQSGSGTPTGTVNMSVDGASIPGQTLSAEVATFPIPGLHAGAHTLVATYGGDSNFSGSTSGNQVLTVNKAPTAVNVVAASGPTMVSGTTTTVSINVSSTTAPTPTGTVNYSVDGAPATTLTLQGGAVTQTFTSTVQGAHKLTALYPAQGDYDTNTGTANVTVTAPSSVDTQVVIAAPNITYGQTAQVTLTVSVKSTGAPCSGSVSLELDGQTSTSMTLQNGQAVFSYSNPLVSGGGHSVMASYAGVAGQFNPSGNNGTFTVNPAATTVTITPPSPASSSAGFTIPVSVSWSGGAASGGSVTLLALLGGKLTPFNLSLGANGTTNFVIAPGQLVAGSYTLVASYSGTPNFSQNASPQTPMTVTA